jgi:hypothetical protein
MASRNQGAAPGNASARTPAQWFNTIVGAVLVLVGLAGFAVSTAFNMGDGVQGGNLLGFEVNGWHNLVHIATGAFLLATARRADVARVAAVGFGAAYAVVTLIGLLDGNDVLRLISINVADNVLHVLLTVGALGAGLASRRDPDARR